MSFERIGTPTGKVKYVLAYQKEGRDNLEQYAIPLGMEDMVDKMITGKDVVRFKSGLVLKQDEIKGIFTQKEFLELERTLFNPKAPPGPGFTEFLEMGKAMKEKKPLDKWKKKKSTNVLPVIDPSELPNPMSSSSSTTND